MKIFYRIIIGLLLLLNVAAYLHADSADALIPVPGLEQATEIFPELLDEIKDPTKLVSAFASGVKETGSFDGGLEQVNVPIMEATDKVMARCVAWMETQPLPGEEPSTDAEQEEFDPDQDFGEFDLCQQDEGYGAALESGASDLLSIEAAKDRSVGERQLNIARCQNMIQNIVPAYQSLYSLVQEGDRMKEEIKEQYETLKEEMKTLKEQAKLLAQTPRVYGDADCT